MGLSTRSLSCTFAVEEMTVGSRHRAAVEEARGWSSTESGATGEDAGSIGSAGERDPTTDRAQLGFDFIAGMSLFLIMVGFVFNFAPVMFDPFTTGQGGEMTAADRTAAALSEDMLADSGTAPNILNDSCTVEFFDTDGTLPIADIKRTRTTSIRPSASGPARGLT